MIVFGLSTTNFPAVWWSTIAVWFRRCDWLFLPSGREVSSGNRSNYKSTRERVDSKGLYERWRLHLISSWPGRVSLGCLLDFISRLHVCASRSSLLARPISHRNEWSFRVYMKLLWSFVQEWNSRLSTTTGVNSRRRNLRRHPILWWCKQKRSHEMEPEWTRAGPTVAHERVLMLINHTLTSASKVPKRLAINNYWINIFASSIRHSNPPRRMPWTSNNNQFENSPLSLSFNFLLQCNLVT